MATFIKENTIENVLATIPKQAAFVLTMHDVGIYFDVNADKFGRTSVKLTSIPGEYLAKLRGHEEGLRKKYPYDPDNKTFMKSTIIERDKYKMMIDARFDRAYEIHDRAGRPLGYRDVLGGMRCDVILYAKEWKVGKKFGYSLYVKFMIIYPSEIQKSKILGTTSEETVVKLPEEKKRRHKHKKRRRTVEKNVK